MRDTTPEFQKRLDQGYAALSPEERVRLCTEMFDTAMTLAAASLPEGLDGAERHFRICERFYGELASLAFPPR
mgnify:CR=1 FL=1